MKQLEVKDNPAFAHMTATAADVWAVISVLKLARLFGIRFIFTVLVQYLFRDIDYSIERLEATSDEQSSLIKKLGKIISLDAGLKTIFGGVKVRDMKIIPKYDKSDFGPVYDWIMKNQSDLWRIDWKEFEKRVKAGSVGDDCPVEFYIKSSVSVNYEDLIKFHGPPSERMVIHIADETTEADMGLSETAILYPDTNPTPAPIQVKPSAPLSTEESVAQLADIVRESGSSIEDVTDAMDERQGAPPQDPPPVPFEAAPQATGEPRIESVDEASAEITEKRWSKIEVTDEQLQSWIDNADKSIPFGADDDSDIPF